MQEELSLREIIETIWNGKWIIAILTVISIVVSGITSFVFIKPTYEAVSTVRIGNGTTEQMVGPNIVTFSETILSDVSVNKMVEKLGLDPLQFSISTIRNKTETQVNDKANTMTFKVRGKDPTAITQLANIMAFELGARIEISERAKTIVEANERIKLLDQQLNISMKELEETIQQLSNTPEKLITRETVSEDPFLQTIIEERLNTSGSQAGQISLEREHINPIYTKLQDRIKEVEISIQRLTTERETQHRQILEHELVISELDAKSYTEMLNTTATNRMMSDYVAVFISPAMEPQDRVSPSHSLNLALGAFMGFIIGLVIVFLRHYWRYSTTVTD